MHIALQYDVEKQEGTDLTWRNHPPSTSLTLSSDQDWPALKCCVGPILSVKHGLEQDKQKTQGELCAPASKIAVCSSVLLCSGGRHPGRLRTTCHSRRAGVKQGEGHPGQQEIRMTDPYDAIGLSQSQADLPLILLCPRYRQEAIQLRISRPPL